MTKEELKKEAYQFLIQATKEKRIMYFGGNLEELLSDFAEPREKQIEIDAEQIRALQKQNGELTDRVKELEAQIEKMKSSLNCKHSKENGFCMKGNGYCICDKWELED